MARSGSFGFGGSGRTGTHRTPRSPRTPPSRLAPALGRRRILNAPPPATSPFRAPLFRGSRFVHAPPRKPVSEPIDLHRRRFFGFVGATFAAFEFGLIGEAEAQGSGTRALAPMTRDSAFGPVKQIDAGLLDVGYVDMGPEDGPAVLLLHGWPYDIHSFADVAPMLASAGYRAIVPYLRGYGSTRFRSASTFRNGQQGAVALDMIALLDALTIERPIIAAFDWGARTADIIAALWPERCKGLVSVSGYLIGTPAANRQPLPPEAELQWWYQYYFATDRGRDGYDRNRRAFNRLIWETASPHWDFDDATYERSAASFENPDHVDIVIHNYRWRLGLAKGETNYDDVERKLALAPAIGVPTITLEGDANGAPHGDPKVYAQKFTGAYEHRTVTGGVGHNLPQEAPREFAQAVFDVDRMTG